MFENATKRKYRYPSLKGSLTTEDLFDLPLQAKNKVDLESVAQLLSEALEKSPKKSFVAKTTPQSAELQNKLDIVVYIIDIKLKAVDAAETSKVKASKRAMLTELLEKKKTEAYEGMSEEDIQKAIDALN